MSTHTPGPWTTYGSLNGKHSVWGLDSVICQTQTSAPEIDNRKGAPTCPETAEANARLIAAAPELLAALKEVAPWVRKWGGASGLNAMVLNAIDKAEGKS